MHFVLFRLRCCTFRFRFHVSSIKCQFYPIFPSNVGIDGTIVYARNGLLERLSRDGDRGGGPLTTFGQPLAYSTYMVQSSFVALLYDIILISEWGL